MSQYYSFIIMFGGASATRPTPWSPPKKLVKIFRWCFILISTVRKQTEGTIGLMYCSVVFSH